MKHSTSEVLRWCSLSMWTLISTFTEVNRNLSWGRKLCQIYQADKANRFMTNIRIVNCCSCLSSCVCGSILDLLFPFWYNIIFLPVADKNPLFHIHPSCGQGGRATRASPIYAKWKNIKLYGKVCKDRPILFSSLLISFFLFSQDKWTTRRQRIHSQSPFMGSEHSITQKKAGTCQALWHGTSSWFGSSRQELADSGGITWTRERNH